MGVVFRHLLLASLLGLSACGGGGGAESPSPAPTPAPAPSPAPALPDAGAVARADPGSPLDADWVHGAVMQIFVRSYQDSDGDGVGDLRGLTQRLDHLQNLGVRGLWLLPITRSQDGDHGYAVRDYRAIEPTYGSLADFDELLRQAHARGIGVILDQVLNHSAAEHPAFQSARSGAGAAYRDWYLWQASVPGGWTVFGSNPWRATSSGAYYAPFWDQMPDWNLRNPAVQAFHADTLRWWLNRGVDGFRIDAAGMLFENGPTAWENQPENWAYLQGIASELGAYSRRLLVCEAPSAPAPAAAACGRAFAFGTQGLLLGAARGDAAALQQLAATPAGGGLSPFLSNHDSFAGQRPFDQLAGELPSLKLAAALNLLREGTPFIYYGEEVGMGAAAALSGDPALRSPMSWTADPLTAGFSTRAPYRPLAANSRTHNVAAQAADPDSLLNHYRALLALRNAEPALLKGSTRALQLLRDANGMAVGLAWWRQWGSEQLLVLVHSARQASTATVSGAPANARLQRRWGAGTELQADTSGQLQLALPAQSLHVFKLLP